MHFRKALFVATAVAALARASFEVLVGFQLTEDQLAYHATR